MHMNIIKQKIKFKINFLTIWDWNISEVKFIVWHFQGLNILLLKGIAQYN